jgi:starch synthase
MEKLKILFATMEIDPFLKISDAASFIRKLPQGLQEKGHEIRILMPRFGVINERRNRLHEVVRLSGINIRVGNEEKPLTIKVATIPNARLQVYFLDNEDYFQRKSVLKDKNDKYHADNDERAIFFCKGVIETVKKLGWTPNIIHCHGWMTALIPLYLKTHFKDDPMFRESKVVYTVYDNEYNHPLPANFAEKAKLEGVPAELLAAYAGDTFVGVSTGGGQLADAVTRGSQKVDDRLEAVLKADKWDIGLELDADDEKSYVEYYNQLYQAILQ